jgi:serine/threonine protein kinase
MSVGNQVSGGAGPVSVLCLDCDQETEQFLGRLLRAPRFSIAFRTSSDVPRRIVIRFQPDVILLTVDQKPVKSLEFCKRIRQHCNAPIIALIGDLPDRVSLIDLSVRRGADDYLLAPVRAPELLAKITQAIRRVESVRGGVCLSPGEIFGEHYEIVDVIGHGGYSTVYWARDLCHRRQAPVAIKVLNFQARSRRDPDLVDSFLKEASQHSQLDHPNIVGLRQYWQMDGLYYLVMDLIEGELLSDHVARTDSVSEEELLSVAEGMASALAYMDKRHLVHRDVKPNNIVLLNDASVKLLDFGLLQRRNDAALTSSQGFRGTPYTLAPEHLDDDAEIHGSSDIYSLGVTLYFAATGSYPFAGDSVVEILRNHTSGEHDRLDELRDDLNSEFVDLVESMLSRDPKERPSAATLAKKFKRLQLQ